MSHPSNWVVLTPDFGPEPRGGIQRVADGVVSILRSTPGARVWVAAANSPSSGDCTGFEGRYARMAVWAAFGRLAFRPGRVLCLHAGLSFVARLLARRYGCPCHVFLHGIEAWRPLPLRTRWGLSGAEAFLSNSRFTWEEFARRHPGLSAKTCRVVPLGVSGRFEAGAEERPANFPAGGRFILSVSRLSREDDYKGHRVLAEAVFELRKTRPDVFLALVGTGNAREELEAWVRSRDASAVLLTGAVSDAVLLWLYRRCAAFALLSEGEGFGLVYAEAMSQSRACVCSDADAAREVVENGITGFAVRPRDPAAASKALARILDDPALAERLGAAGNRRYQSLFTFQHFKDRLLSVLIG